MSWIDDQRKRLQALALSTGRNVRDIFDANTAADQARRVAKGQPVTYQEQQAQRRAASQQTRPSQMWGGAQQPSGRAETPIQKPTYTVRNLTNNNEQADTRTGLTKFIAQVNPLDAGKTWQQQNMQTKDSALMQAVKGYPRAVAAPFIGLPFRTTRTAIGIGQGISGLADLAPGDGVNRISKALDVAAKEVDKTAQKTGSNWIYKPAGPVQEGALYALSGGALAGMKGAALAGKTGQAAKFGSVLNKIDEPVKNITQKALGKGRVGKTVSGAIVTPEVIPDVVGTAKYIGEDTSKGKEITPERLAVDVATGIGGGLVGSVTNNIVERFAKKQLFDRLAKESDPEVVGKTIKDANTGLTDEQINKVKGDIAITTDKAEVENIIKNVSEPAQAPTPAVTDDIANTLTATSKPEEVRFVIDNLLPKLPEAEKVALANNVAKSTDTNQIKQLMDEAKARESQLDETMQANTPAEAVPTTQAEQTQQAMEEAIPAPKPAPESTQAPISQEPTTTAPDGVQGATTADNVPGAAPIEKTADGSDVDLGSYINKMAESQGINTEYQAPKLFAFNRLLNAVTGGKKQNLMQISPFRWAAQRTEDLISSQAQKANVSKRGSKILNTARLGFAQTGMSDVVRMAARKFRDAQSLAGDMIKGEMKIMDNLVKSLADKEQSLDNIYRVIADNDILARTHGDGARLSLDDLTPEERVIADRIIDAQRMTNEINYKIGKITKEQYEAEKETGHYARIFDIDSKKGKSLGKKPIDTKPFIGQKDASEFSDNLMEQFVTDPSRGALARQEIALRSLASHEFMGELVSQGRLLPTRPNKGFQQLTGKKFGQFEGMWADNTTRSQIKQNMEFNTDFAKKYVGEALDDFKASPFGKVQRNLKATKTVLNPGTNVQNLLSNVLLFNRGSGVGMIRNVMGMTRAAKDLTIASKKGLTAELIQAKKLGVFGSDSGKAMTGDIGAEDLASIPGKKNVVMRGLGVAEDAYGGADNAAKLALWRNLQRKGLSPEDAARQVQKFTQDYHNVGRIVGAMADAPVLGKPFARFIPELIRLSKNNIIYNPAGTMASLAALAYAGNALSERAGESDEDRKNREEAAGNTSIPGTALLNKTLGGPDRNISLNFALGDSSINIARAIGLNFPIEPGQDPNRALLEQLLPFEVPTRKDAQGNEVFDITKVVTNLGLRPIIEVATDTNFMGRSIQDPENKTYVEGSELGKKYQGEISTREKVQNVAGHLARAYLPMSNEADSLYSAVKGGPNAMGKEQSVTQAALRVLGLKVEKNDKATREKRASTKQYFEGKVAQVNDFLNKNPDLKEQYLKLKSGTIDRTTGKKVVDLIKPEKWRLVYGDKSGRLFEQLKTEDIYQNQQDKDYPIDPIYSDQLSQEQRNQLLSIRSSVTGDNIEQEEILRATQPWYTNFETAERDHQKKLSAYFDKLKAEGKLNGDTQNDRVKAYGELYDKYAPQQTPLMQEYYKTKETDPEGAKDLFEVYPELSDQFAAYKEQKLKYINELRKMEGAPEIDRNTFMNVTFGYEDDERKVYNELKYGKGYGSYGKFGYGSGGSKSKKTTEQQIADQLSPNISSFIAGIKPSEFGPISQVNTKPSTTKFKVKLPSGSTKKARIRLQ